MKRMKKYMKHSYGRLLLLICVTILTFMSLNLLTPKAMPVAKAAEGETYKKIATDRVMATGYQDALTDINQTSDSEEKAEKQETLNQNLTAIINGGNFGNVGLLIGPHNTTQNIDSFSALFSSATLDKSMIDWIDEVSDSSATKYQKFGGAIQSLNKRGQHVDETSATIDNSLNGIATSAMSIANMGTNLLRRYNPAPIVLALIDSSILTDSTYADNRLFQVVLASDDLRGLINLFGGPSGILPSVPLSFVIVAVIIMLLLITSTLLTLMNGRAAGENIRKALVKLVIAAVGIPLIAQALTVGVNFLDDFTATAETTQEQEVVSKHLNFADWAATGFSLPSGTTLLITSSNEFKFTNDDIKNINHFTYEKATGDRGTDAEVAERLLSMMDEANNYSSASFSQAIRKRDGQPWNTNGLYQVAEALGENNKENLVSDIEGFDNIGYISYAGNYGNEMTLTQGTDGITASVTGNGGNYGISPIAVTNLLRSSFSTTKISAGRTDPIISTVVVYASNDTSSSSNMPGFVRFLATFSMIMAAMTGLFSVIAAGFGGILSGGAKSALGSSQGFGQALGGVIALVGGVFGIGLIMTLSYTVLDELYAIVMELFSGATADESILEPIGEIFEGIKIIGPFLADCAKTIASLIITVMAMLMLPKFGGIPIKMFCQALSNLPSMFAERAQQIENKFTGDFRSGGGGFGNMGSPLSGMKEDAKARAGAIGTGAAAIAGFGLSKIGGAISNRLGDGSTDSEHSGDDTPTGDESVADPMNAGSPDDITDNTSINESEEMNEGADTINDGSDRDDRNESESVSESDTVSDNDSDTESIDQDDSVAENISDTESIDQDDSVAENVTDSETVDQDDSVSESTSDSDKRDQNNSVSDNVSDNDTVNDNDSLAENMTDKDSMLDSDTIDQNDSLADKTHQTDSRAENMANADSVSDQDSVTNQNTDKDTSYADHSDTDAVSSDDSLAENDSFAAAMTNSDNFAESNVEASSLAENDSAVEAMADNDNLSEIDSVAEINNMSDHANQSNSVSEHTNESSSMSTNNNGVDSGRADTRGSTPSTRESVSGNRGGTSSRHRTTGNENNRAPNVSRDGSVASPRNAGSQSQNQNRSGNQVQNRPGSRPQPNAVRNPNATSSQSGTPASGSQSNTQKPATGRGNKFVRGLARGMQAAGGDTSGRQALAGALHIAGGATGLQNVTGRNLERSNRNAQRRRDIQDGLGRNYSQNQDPGKKAQTTQNRNTEHNNRQAQRMTEAIHRREQELRERQEEDARRRQ